jgi:nitroreductase
MDVMEAIRMKRAVRKFSEKPLADEEVRQILNAGRRAQSSKNTQPWHFIAIRDRDLLTRLSTYGRNAGHIAGAAMAVAITTPDPGQRLSIMFDAGQAAGYMQLAAWEIGIGSCLASIQDEEQARSLLGFPEDRFLRIAISFGYPADATELTRPLKSGGRDALEQGVSWDHW